MSIRDTGWVREPDGAFGRWIGDDVFLLAQADGYWHVGLGNGGRTLFDTDGAADLESAKRAAEDALRTLCRDTLAALDATEKRETPEP